jgi:peroxiredoxin/uncharacterized membrane protein YphA (DoxX/SURF4 family)
MNTVLIASRFGLAAVFLVAALAKLADMSGSRRALEGFRVPTPFIAAGSVALPVAEIAAAVLLLLPSTARAGAALACALLLAFVAGIAAALRRGSAPDCHCFGQLHSKPAGKETVGRNVALAAVGAFILFAGPGPGLASWLAASSGPLVALAATGLLAVGLAYACASLWRDNRELRRPGGAQGLAAEPLQVGQAIPDVTVAAQDGREVRSRHLLSEAQRTVFVFTSATCGPCVGLLPELARWRAMLVGRLDIRVLASGDAEENRRLASEHGMPMFLDEGAAAANAFGILGTPSAVEIDLAGQVAAPAAAGAVAIEGLIRAALKRPSEPSGIDVRDVSGKLSTPTAGVAS